MIWKDSDRIQLIPVKKKSNNILKSIIGTDLDRFQPILVSQKYNNIKTYDLVGFGPHSANTCSKEI